MFSLCDYMLLHTDWWKQPVFTYCTYTPHTECYKQKQWATATYSFMQKKKKGTPSLFAYFTAL